MQLEFLLNYIPFISSFLILFSIYLIMSLSLNLEYGYAGVPNFGHVFFMSIGAYVAGVLTARALDFFSGSTAGYCSGQAADIRGNFAVAHPEISIGLFVVSLILGAIIGGLFGYIGAYPALRLKEDFLAITLIFIGEIGRIIARNEDWLVCGLTGLTGIANPFKWVENVHMRSIIYTALTLAFAVLIYVYTERLVQSPYGRLLKSIRDDEIAAMALGKEVPKIRGLVMIIGSSLAAIAGVLRTFYLQSVVADDFLPLVTFIVLSMVILGGMANNKGVIVGTLIMMILDMFISPSFFAMMGVIVEFDITYLKYVLIGVIIILVLMFKPEGIIPEGPVRTPAVELSMQAEEEVEKAVEELIEFKKQKEGQSEG